MWAKSPRSGPAAAASALAWARKLRGAGPHTATPAPPASLGIKSLHQNGFLFLPCYFYCYSTVGNPAGRAELVGNCTTPAQFRATGTAAVAQMASLSPPGSAARRDTAASPLESCWSQWIAASPSKVCADINNPFVGVGKDEHMCRRLWSPYPLAAPGSRKMKGRLGRAGASPCIANDPNSPCISFSSFKEKPNPARDYF